MLQKRQVAWLVTDVAQDGVHQAGLRLGSGQRKRLFDHFPQAVGAGSLHIVLVGSHSAGQFGMFPTVRIEVGAQSDQNVNRALRLKSGGGEQRIHVCPPSCGCDLLRIASSPRVNVNNSSN